MSVITGTLKVSSGQYTKQNNSFAWKQIPVLVSNLENISWY